MSKLIQIVKLKTKDMVQFLKENHKKLLPLFAFVIPVFILYTLYPYTFEPTWTGTWKNRLPHLFFLWLFSLETILMWEELHDDFRLRSARTVALTITLILPTAYVIIANYLGLNSFIVSLAKQVNIKSAWAELMPLSVEYIVFAVLFASLVFLEYGKSSIKKYSISAVFLPMIGSIYTIDNIYPFGEFTPFQILVLPTARLAANVLNLMGYRTIWLSPIDNMPTFYARDSMGNSSPPFSITWPCSGVESLLIYTVTILLFLKKSDMSLKLKMAYFAIGAVITYFINILRIVTIYIIAINKGDWGIFHDYYGQLYSIMWIISYPLIIMGTQALWGKIKTSRMQTTSDFHLPSQTGS